MTVCENLNKNIWPWLLKTSTVLAQGASTNFEGDSLAPSLVLGGSTWKRCCDHCGKWRQFGGWCIGWEPRGDCCASNWFTGCCCGPIISNCAVWCVGRTPVFTVESCRGFCAFKHINVEDPSWPASLPNENSIMMAKIVVLTIRSISKYLSIQACVYLKTGAWNKMNALLAAFTCQDRFSVISGFLNTKRYPKSFYRSISESHQLYSVVHTHWPGSKMLTNG